MEEIAKKAGITVAQLEQATAETLAFERANREPFPGATADAFALPQYLEVGKFRIRPFYDIDIEFLKQLNHPMHKMITGEGEEFMPRGQDAWRLCWLFTRPEPDGAEKMLSTIEALFALGAEGIAKIDAEAKAQFCAMQVKAILAIETAIVAQIKSSFGTVVGDEKKTDLKASSPQEIPTDTVGS